MLIIYCPMLFHLLWLVCTYPKCYIPYALLTGGASGSSKKSRPRPRIMEVNEYGDMTEQNIVRERAKEAAK